ncbi:hypothetical protein INR49_023657 [Caranx melampygus]|nr:hypothetical protein INR49_023657 [Caranx melampygus]
MPPLRGATESAKSFHGDLRFVIGHCGLLMPEQSTSGKAGFSDIRKILIAWYHRRITPALYGTEEHRVRYVYTRGSVGKEELFGQDFAIIRSSESI